MANIWDEYERDLFSEKKKKDEKPASSNIWDELEQEHFNPKPQAGLTSSQISSSIDRYQSGLYGVGEAIAEGVGAKDSAEWLKAKRQENEFLADKAAKRAHDLGAVDRWEDVHGVGDFGSYAKGLAIQSLPYAGEALAGGILARGAMTGTRAALAGAKTLEEAAAAKKALDIGSQAGAVAASYPSAVGDVLSNQREQSGETRGGVAAALAVPYAALNAIGVESALARGTAFKNTVNILDRGTGLSGAAARMAATGAGVAFKEGASETGQEMLNQVGRMSVDSNEAFLSAAAQERFKESFIGGATLGGVAGAVGGGWRRSSAGGNEVSQAIGDKAATQPDITTTDFQARGVSSDLMAGLAGRGANPLAGRSNMIGGELPVLPPQTAPAVTGGTTDVAQASTGITQAQYAEQQRQQQDAANQIARDKTFQTLGAQYSPDNTGQLTIFGGTLFDDAKINVFGNTLAAKFNALPETAHTVADAIAQANELTGGKVIKVSLNAANPVGAANTVMKALATTADKFQIGHVQTVQQAANILETLSQTEKGNKLEQLNAIHYALTGEDTTGFTAAQQAKPAKGAKNGQQLQVQQQATAGLGTVPVEGGTGTEVTGGDGSVRPTEVQPVGTTSVGEGPLELQTGQPPASGVRASAGTDTNLRGGQPTSDTQVSEAPSEETQTTKPRAKLGVPVRVKATGKQGAPSVQPTPAPAAEATQRQEAKLSQAEELWNDMDATDTPYASLTPALKQAWDKAIETNSATGAIQEQIADQANDRAQETKADRLIAGILQTVIRPYGRLDEESAQKKREFFQAFWGGAKLDSLSKIAKDMGITIDQALKWHAELPKFLEKNGDKIIAAAAHVAESQGMTMRELEQLLEGIEAKRQKKVSTVAQVTGEEEESGQGTSATEEPVESDTTGEDEFSVDELTSEGGRDEGPEVETEAEAAPDTNIRTRKSLSLQEQFNAVETNNARILRTMEAIEKAKADLEKGKTPEVPVEELEVRLAVEMDYAKQLYTKNLAKGEFGRDLEQTKEEIAKDEKRLATETAKKLQEKANAVQEPSAKKVSVRKRAGSGKTLGEGNAERGQAATEAETKVEEPKQEEVKTDAEKAADAWDAVVKDIPGAPLFAELSQDQQETFTEYGEENWTRADVVAELKKLSADDERFEREMRAAASATQTAPDDVKTTALRFVPYAKALEIARQAVAAGVPVNWVQFHSRLDLINESAVRLVDAIKAEQTSSAMAEAVRFSKMSATDAAKPVTPQTRRASEVASAIDDALGTRMARNPAWSRFVQVHDSAAAAFEATGRKIPMAQLANAQGFVDPRDTRVVHLIASNIAQGSEMSVLIHELGVHVGLKDQMGSNFKLLEAQVRSWKNAPKNSMEYKVWEAATARNVAATLEGAVTPETSGEELVAYAAEEAVRRGVKPSKNAQDKLGRFLQSIKELVERAFTNFFKPETLPTVNAQDLVDFAFAAAQNRAADVRTELGTTRGAADTQIMRYYAGTDKLNDTARIANENGTAAGQEEFYWGDDSKFGAFTKISTDGFRYRTREKQDVFQMVVTSAESRKVAQDNPLPLGGNNEYDDVLQTVLLVRNPGASYWDLTVQGPDPSTPLYYELLYWNQVTKTRDNYGDDNWTRLERIPMRDTRRVLMEARRRLTRSLGGAIPDIRFTRVTGSGANLDEGRPGGYTADELAVRFSKMPKPLQASTKTVVDALLDSGKATMINRNEDVKHILLAAGITEDVVNGASKYMPSAQDYLNNQYERQGTRIEHEQRIQKIEEAFEKLPTELQGTGRGSVNEFIFDSTSNSKWGYVPTYNPNIKPDEDMAKRFNAMPDAAQAVIKMVFDHGYQSLRLKQKAVKAAADKEFSQREADANGDQEALNEIAAERTAWESKFDRLMNIKNDMPYAYLGRYGDYVAVAKSETYVDAEKLAAQGDLDATKWLEQNQSDANHYIVEFAETMAEAQSKAEQWKATGQYQQVYGAEKEVSEAFVGGSDLFMGITRLRNMITRRIKSGELTIADQATLDALHKTVSDLYLATVSEASAHRTAMQRKNISGADKDMMRNLATRGRADAHFLASLKHNDSITDAISNMRDEAKGDPTNARPYLNELLKRYANDINYKTPAPWSRMMTRLGHTWFLSFNPAFYLQQMTQTYVLSLPYMAGRLGYHRSLRSINAAYKDVVSLVKDTNVNEHLDFSKAPADVRDMLLKLVRMGKIDIGIDADAVVYANERTLTSSVMRKLNGVNNRIEAVNRATAAVAAYRGYLQRFGANNTEAATKFAAETVSNTHGSYDGFNTPRILNSNVGRVVGQFKRFQIIQLSMLGKLIKNAFKGASAEERMVARRSLAFITSHMAVLGGALGVPFVSQIANLLNHMFGDDDEPKDLEYQLRQAIGDPALASLLTRGVPAFLGVESLGKKLAMENVASILPFTDVDLTSRSGAEKMLVALMGPSAALSLKAADALGLIGQGEYYKGLEQALPSGFANAMKAYRFATEGITLRNGDVVLSPEEVSMVDAAFQAVGLPTNTITQRQYRQNVEKEFDKFFQTKATEIKGDYVAASREGDGPAMTEARQMWQELQESRAKHGYTKQPMSELFKAVMAARKREASTVEGVETTKANRQFVKNII